MGWDDKGVTDTGEQKIMDYKEVMDLWYVWTVGGIIIYKYIKGIVDTWDE